MDTIIEKKKVLKTITEFDSKLNVKFKEAAIILAAGHGKRIKSRTSKMLHRIWGKPTALRVYEACRKGFNKVNTVMVVGIKADEVIQAVGKKENLVFSYQEEQLGTGHAVQVGIKPLKKINFNGIIYVLPGDMGLLNAETIIDFKKKFNARKFDMMVLTGIYEGAVEDNYYGRIIRVPEKDAEGNPSGDDKGKVMEIIEHKDILKLDEKKTYMVKFRNRIYTFTKKELLEIKEFNTGVYAFKSEPLFKYIKTLNSNNVQNEIYITDMIAAFNNHGLNVGASSPADMTVVIGFNNKSVLKEMETIARNKIYDKLKDIIVIDEPDDFFICEECVEDIIKLDKLGVPLDIFIGKGVHIGQGVKLNYGVTIFKNTHISGNIIFGKNVTVYRNVHLSTYPRQKMIIGDNVQILWGDIIKGNIIIGNDSRIESSVNMTGSDEFPLRIGNNVLIKGTSYLFGSIVDDDVFIEHCVLIKKHVERNLRKDGTVVPVRFYLPMPEGIDSITQIK